MPWSRAGHVKVTWSRFCVNDPDIESSFVSNQTVRSTSLLPSSSLLYRLGYNLLSYRLGYNLPYISTSSFWSRNPMCLTEPRPSSLLDGRLAWKNYLQISAFLDPVVVEREGVSHALWKATGGATSKVVTRRLAGRSQAWLSGRQHQFLLPSCVVEARLPCVVETAEGLDVTLDDPAGLRRWILIDGWM